MPSESTVRRVLRQVDVAQLEQYLAEYGQHLALQHPAPPSLVTSRGEALRGQALDGKEVRGVRAHGRPLHLLSLVEHRSGQVLGQRAVADKHNEITAAPGLLAGRDLRGIVITVDALLTQRQLAQQIVRQQGHYLMVVKRNQSQLYQAIALLFEQPPWLPREKDQHCQVYHSSEKGHGRLEQRRLESSGALTGYVDWPSAQQVLRRQCRRLVLKTGQLSSETTYAITSLPYREVSAAALEHLWRGHWGIENRVHRVRDVTLGEDACQVHTGSAPRALAALRNFILSLFRQHNWRNIADAIRYYGASIHRTLDLIGAAPT
jgi:predicted transposase YbfD/YdcC